MNIRDLPDLRTLTNYKPWQITRLFDRHGNAFAEFSEQRRTLIPYDQVPKHLIHAILAAEDAAFFNHRGLDYSGILRAFWKNLWKKRGAPKQGGSTITQQVVKTFLFSPKQHYRRKLREALLARQLEQNLSKKEILYLYLNQIYFGRGCYGIEEAARYYFNKTTKQLSIAESAVLAGIPKNPPRYNPAAYPKDAQKRRNYVLRMMYRQGWLSFDTYEALRKTILKKRAYPRHYPFQRSYYTEEIKRRTLRKIQDTLPKTWSLQRRQRYAQQIFYRNGLRIETALDPELQKRAQQSVRQTLEQKFASPTIPSQHTPTTASHLPQAALVAIDIRTHLVRALVGGRNVTDSPFNRTTQAVRPPGSAFKPILYAAALAVLTHS
ncbi:MAG: transglycosylase domain-containing protein [Myxococcota bacterium]